MNRYLPVLQAIELQNTDEGENDLDGDGDGDGENPLMMVMVMMHMLMLPPMLMLLTLSFHCDHEHVLDRQSMPNGQSCPISATAPRSDARAPGTFGGGRELG